MSKTPFTTAPLSGQPIEVHTQIRIAHALEFIAHHLGETNERLAAQEKRIEDERIRLLQDGLKVRTADMQAVYGKPQG
jgi:hypothetical protein